MVIFLCMNLLSIIFKKKRSAIPFGAPFSEFFSPETAKCFSG